MGFFLFLLEDGYLLWWHFAKNKINAVHIEPSNAAIFHILEDERNSHSPARMTVAWRTDDLVHLIHPTVHGWWEMVALVLGLIHRCVKV